MKTIYYADFSTNNGTCNSFPFEYTNRRLAIKSIREIGIGNTPMSCSVAVSVKAANGDYVYLKTIQR